MSLWAVILTGLVIALLLGKLLGLVAGLIGVVEFFVPERGESAGGWLLNRAVSVVGFLVLLAGAVIVVLGITNSHSGRPMSWGDAGIVVGGFAVGVLGMKIWMLPQDARGRGSRG